MRRIGWIAYTLLYVAGAASFAWLAIDSWEEPYDGPLWQTVLAVAVAVTILLVLYLIGVLPFWLRLSHPLAHGVAAVVTLVAGFVVGFATWGAALANMYLLLGLAVANAYAAVRSLGLDGFGGGLVMAGLVVAIAWFTVWAALLLAALVAAALAVSVVRPRPS